jgi:hypothetical protein
MANAASVSPPSRVLERLEPHADASSIRMVSYQSEEAKQALGGALSAWPSQRCVPGRGPNGEVDSGFDAFLALLPGFKGGRVLSALLSVPWLNIRPSAVLVCGSVPVLCFRLSFSSMMLKSPPAAFSRRSDTQRTEAYAFSPLR